MTVTLDSTGAIAANANLWNAFSAAVKIPAKATKSTDGKIMQISRNVTSDVATLKPGNSRGSHLEHVIKAQPIIATRNRSTKFVITLNVSESLRGPAFASRKSIGMKTGDNIPATNTI